MAWLFWFCEALALCVGAKPNVPNALAKNFLCALGIFLFFSVSGCCLVRYRSVGSGGRPAIATNEQVLAKCGLDMTAFSTYSECEDKKK